MGATTVLMEQVVGSSAGGRPWLAAARTAGLDPAVLTQIAPFASTGIPNVQDLFRELGGLIPEMLKVSAPAAQEGTYLDRLQAWLRGNREAPARAEKIHAVAAE